MIFVKFHKQIEDARGEFLGIINVGDWKEINYLATLSGNTRGGHSHKYSEMFFILKGLIEVYINDNDPVPVGKNDIFKIEPNEFHTFKCLTDCEWINMLSEKFDG